MVLNHIKKIQRKFILNVSGASFWISTTILCFWIFTTFFEDFIPVESTVNGDVKYMYFMVQLIGFPIASIPLAIRVIALKGAWWTTGQKTLLMLCGGGFLFLTWIGLVFGGFCRWSSGEMKFENRHSSSIRIIERCYSCAAVSPSALYQPVCPALFSPALLV